MVDMIGMNNNSTEDIIVAGFLEQSRTAQDIRSYLSAQKKSLSLTSLYEQLNKLVEKHILIKTGKMYSLNKEWLQYMRDLLHPRNEYILSAGEKMKYQLTELSRAEMYWKHIMHSLYISYPNEAIFMYNPHSFWSLIPGRKASEDNYVNHHEKNKRYGYYVLGGTTIHDINLRKQYSARYYKVDIHYIESFSRNEHITVIGDLVFTMKIPIALAKKIDQLYLSLTDETILAREIGELEKHTWRIDSKIEHNAKKAQILRRRIGQQFLSKKELDKFDED